MEVFVAPEGDVTPWEEHTAFLPTLALVLARPRRFFARMADGDVGHAWTFAALCCLVPRLLYGVTDGRGGPWMMLLRASLSAAVQAASATFFLGSAHFLFTFALARQHAHWRISARAAAYAQPITMVIGTLVAAAMLYEPAWRESVALRDGALLASAAWYSVPLFWVGRDRLGLDVGRALAASLLTSFGLLLALRAIS
ncbi:MAG: hypothetical protein ABW352_17020 [Polyangiales bacterium]